MLGSSLAFDIDDACSGCISFPIIPCSASCDGCTMYTELLGISDASDGSSLRTVNGTSYSRDPNENPVGMRSSSHSRASRPSICILEPSGCVISSIPCDGRPTRSAVIGPSCAPDRRPVTVAVGDDGTGAVSPDATLPSDVDCGWLLSRTRIYVVSPSFSLSRTVNDEFLGRSHSNSCCFSPRMGDAELPAGTSIVM